MEWVVAILITIVGLCIIWVSFNGKNRERERLLKDKEEKLAAKIDAWNKTEEGMAESRARAIREAAELEERRIEVKKLADTEFERLVELTRKLDIASSTLRANDEVVQRLTNEIKMLTVTLEARKKDAAEIEERVNSIAKTEGEMRRRETEKCRGKQLEFEDWERAELKELMDVVNILRNPVPLEKAIYDIYYKNKLNGLTVGLDGVSGIYRISVEQDGKEINYVGQTVNFKDRWTQHLKRMVGAEEATAVKLYGGARKAGIENLRWEVLERCGKDELSEREKYWGEYYDVKNGWNVRVG